MSFNITENSVATHDLNATILSLLGFDHKRLAFLCQGRDCRLAEIHGEQLRGIMVSRCPVPRPEQ
jgi:hypothetical protein